MDFSARSAVAATSLAAAVVVLLRLASKRQQLSTALRDVKLKDVSKDSVPQELRVEHYFDFQAHAFEHAGLLTSAKDVVSVLAEIHGYILSWLDTKKQEKVTKLHFGFGCGDKAKIIGTTPAIIALPEDPARVFEPDKLIGRVQTRSAEVSTEAALMLGSGVQVFGGTFDLRAGDIWLGDRVVVEDGVHIAGPAIFGADTVVRSGAYVRGDVIVGSGAVLRGELKNVVIMDKAELAHPGYAGDSIIGFKGHFGCQALTANLGLFGAELTTVVPSDTGIRYALGRRKLGTILGDGSQLGCSTVADPGCFVAPRTHIYPLTRLAAGFYGPDEIVKNKPAECGVVTRSSLR
eukprot:TRINITY_DN60264_c0_g1_i1.p1 TRINITY_DN60264_c0_g1~~TRINITY_DN60264_c0_g1_i1.p1  ORF type:complete len:348 (-),score=48.97 TRINITY_DN60264_c0_g1_i1:72-1115(-)